MGNKDEEGLGALLLVGLGGLVGASLGHAGGYNKAKAEDASYIDSIENENGTLRAKISALQSELFQERENNAKLREELKLRTERVQLISKK